MRFEITKRRFLLIAGLAAGFLCLFLVRPTDPVAVPQQTALPEGWPPRLGERALYACEYGFLYAGEKSSADQLWEVLATVVEDARQEGVRWLGVGLILAVDAGEEYPCEVGRLVEHLKQPDPNLTEEESAKKLKVIADTEKGTQDLGLDMSVMLSLGPIAIRPATAHELVEGLPGDVGRRVRWCVICPTDDCLQACLKKMIDAGLEKAKPSLAKRAAMTAMRPLIERAGLDMMKKGRQTGLYRVLLSKAQDLSPEQRRQKIAAYEERLGLNQKFDPNDDPNR